MVFWNMTGLRALSKSCEDTVVFDAVRNSAFVLLSQAMHGTKFKVIREGHLAFATKRNRLGGVMVRE
jgi:hypothetical protein